MKGTDGKRQAVSLRCDRPSVLLWRRKGKQVRYEDVKNLLAEARLQHVDGIVLDLSRNGGGLLREAVRLAGLFLGKGGKRKPRTAVAR